MEALTTTASGRNLYPILDNLRVHHSKRVSQWVENHKDETIREFQRNYITGPQAEHCSQQHNCVIALALYAVAVNRVQQPCYI